MMKRVLLGVAVLVLFLTPMIVLASVSAATETGSGKDSVLEASFLLSEVKRNQLRFDRTYGEKAIYVVGYAGTIQEGRDGDLVINLQGDERMGNPFEYIQCRFPADQEDTVFAIDKGDRIVVRGVYRGKQDFQIGSLVLFDCRIVPAP